jgi:hypothetical protein
VLGPHEMADQFEWIPKDKTLKTNKLSSLDKLELEVLNVILR